MEYSRMFSAVPENFPRKRKKFLTNPIYSVHGAIILLRPVYAMK